ncbi:MAG TPA: BadF/BadG/BcrA/BcrD ATPase family protein [Planctomycetota bacterium]|nr:BadF/BadG/BcrA/BcrD ATPase family protein [Planctomycetota bacterium]
MNFLGLDVGGTHCRYEWWPTGSRAGGHARPVQPAVHGIEATADGLFAALAAACRGVEPSAAVLALAGAGDAGTSAAIGAGLRARGITFPVAVVGDVLAAAAAALRDGPGVLLWAGTGSFAVARRNDGGLERVGGRGYLLGDQGSGYDVVRRAAAAVLLAQDGLGPATALTEALTNHFAAPSPLRLGAALQQLDPGSVAAALPRVLDVVAAGDPVANEVLAGAVDALAMLAAAAVRKAELDWAALPVALGGGVLLGAGAVTALVSQRLAALGAVPPQLVEARAAARGAAWLAHGWHTRLEPQRTWVDRVAL